MIDTGRLFEFCREVIHIRNEELEEETAWEVWLHKVFEQSWQDFRASLNDDSTNAAPTQEDLKRTASESANLLANFRPPDGGGEQGGTVQTVGDDSG
jgi:hypothetical protein